MKNKARDECLLDACPKPGYVRGCAVKPFLDNSSVGICLRNCVVAPIRLEVRLDSYSRMHVQHEFDHLFRAECNHIISISPSSDNAILQALPSAHAPAGICHKASTPFAEYDGYNMLTMLGHNVLCTSRDCCCHHSERCRSDLFRKSDHTRTPFVRVVFSQKGIAMVGTCNI